MSQFATVFNNTGNTTLRFVFIWHFTAGAVFLIPLVSHAKQAVHSAGGYVFNFVHFATTPAIYLLLVISVFFLIN